MSILDRLIRHATRRPPDKVIGGPDRPYLLRWHLVRTRLLGIYLHRFLRSDDDRALHDHPWANVSILLRGEYTEHTPEGSSVLRAPRIRVRLSARLAHRIELHAGPCWTLFIRGPVTREWGFHCADGWVHWTEFTDKGCGP